MTEPIRNPWEVWAEKAIAANPELKSVSSLEPRQSRIMLTNPFKPSNWYPKNAVNRIKTAENPKSEYIKVVQETMANFVYYAEANTTARDEPLALPEDYTPETAQWVESEAIALSPMLVQGSVNELRAIEYLTEKRELTPLKADKSAFEDKEAMEKAGIDILTRDAKGRRDFWQVKSSESQAKQFSSDYRVRILLVTNGEVKEL